MDELLCGIARNDTDQVGREQSEGLVGAESDVSIDDENEGTV